MRVVISDQIKPGSYYVIACADTQNKVREQRENNNCTASNKIQIYAATNPEQEKPPTQPAPPVKPLPSLTSPENASAPSIAGNATSGEVLLCDKGTWIGNPQPTITYQWFKNNTLIEGSDSNTYIITNSDRNNNIKCEVTAKNSVGSISIVSNSLLVDEWYTVFSGTEITRDYVNENIVGKTKVRFQKDVLIKDYAFSTYGSDGSDCSCGTADLTSLKELSLLDMKSIPVLVFTLVNLNNLTTLDIPNTEIIGDFAFALSDLSSLTEMDLSLIETIGGNAFSSTDLSSLTEINLPLVSTLSSGQFNQSNLSSLTTLNLPNATELSNYTFADSDLSNLTRLTITNVTTLKDSVFASSNLSSLAALDMPNLQTIGDGVFYNTNMSSLTKLDISGAQSVAGNSFYTTDLSGLIELHLGDITKIDFGNSFIHTDKGSDKLYVNVSNADFTNGETWQGFTVVK